MWWKVWYHVNSLWSHYSSVQVVISFSSVWYLSSSQICESQDKPLYLAALLQQLRGEKCIVFLSSVESTHRLCSLLNFFGELQIKIKEYSRLQRQVVRRYELCQSPTEAMQMKLLNQYNLSCTVAKHWRHSEGGMWKCLFLLMPWHEEWTLKGWKMSSIMTCLLTLRHIFIELVGLLGLAKLDAALHCCGKMKYVASAQ